MKRYYLKRKIKAFLKTNWRVKLLAIEIFLLCGIVRATILIIPFRKIQPYLGERHAESTQEVEIRQYKIAHQMSWMIEQVSGYTPWRSECLVQAITAQYLLKKRGIATTLYLGVNKSLDQKFNAHAWLRCGRIFVTGGNNKDAFKVISKFSNEKMITRKRNQFGMYRF